MDGRAVNGDRGRVDPELLTFLDRFPDLVLSMETLQGVRAAARQPPPDAPPPDQPVRTVRRAAPGRDGAPDVTILIHRPEAAAGPLPCILHMHGGGYVFGAPEADAPHHRRLAAELNCCIASIAYRLAPETIFPGQIEDCYAALTWLGANAAALQIDAARIGVMGESAGGGLAAALALLARDRGEVALAFQHLIYPMIDDRTGLGDPAPLDGAFVWNAHNNQFGWRALLGDPSDGQEASPYAAAARALDVSGLPPTFISTGTLDLLAGDALAYAARLLCAGVAIELHVYPGAFHGFDYAPDAAVAIRARRDARAALARALHPPAD